MPRRSGVNGFTWACNFVDAPAKLRRRVLAPETKRFACARG